MRLIGLVGLCALLPWALCSCGSGEASAGPMDAAMEASAMEAGRLDAPADVAEADAPADSPMDAPLDARISSACDNTGLQAGCVVGACTVSATGMPLPNGVALTVTQKAVPSDLNGDTLGSVLCSITLPADAGIQTLANLNLSIGLSQAPDANAALFQYVSPQLSREVPTSQPSGNAVVGLVTAPGDFGATERPGPPALEAALGLDVSSSGDEASLLRNLSSQPMYSAFYDGTRLYVCNGSRLLLYKGIPKDPTVKPDVVLGQPDLNTVLTQPTSSIFQGCSGVWSDGTRLVVAAFNRILIWNTIPSTVAPADLVLGQPDFASNKANNGGVGATSLSYVASIDSDGTRIAAAEVYNNRVLVWNKFPTVVDQPADFVVGQPGFTTNQANNGATPIYQSYGVLFDSSGLFVTGQFSPGLVHVPSVTANNEAPDFTVLPQANTLQPPDATYTASRIARTPSGGLAVRDSALYRVSMFKTVPTGAGHIDFVLGQPDVTRVVTNQAVTASVVATSPAGEQGLGAGQAVLLVPDSRRLLVFDTPPSYNFFPASRVIGQAGFTTNGTVDYRGISASTLAGPSDVSSAGGFVAVADRGNNRVLVYKASDIAASNFSAAAVVGQPDATSYIPNLDQQTPSASRLSGPAGVALDGTHLIVADSENHRVLIWNTVPSATAAPADLVLGQANFTDRSPNRGQGDANGDGYSDANANGFFYPTGVASDGTHLFVADRLNNRVLVWKTFPSSNGQAADAVIGQPDFTSSQPNRSYGVFTFVRDGLDLPTGVTLAGTSLWIADTENNRIVRWDNVTTTPVFGKVVGQTSDSAVSNPNYNVPPATAVGFQAAAPATNANSVLRPRAIAIANGTLFVSEADSNRIHMFDSATFAPAGELGQAADTTSTANANGVGATSLSTPMGIASDGSTLWVADSSNHRVLGFDTSARPSTGASAKEALGQPGFGGGGFNQATTAAGGVTSQPGGIALLNGSLYIADTGNHRVLVMQTPVKSGQMPARVYGQPDPMQALANSGGAPSASTLSSPQGVFVDSKHLIIADTGNNRVLVYDPNATAPAAQLVLGQATFASASANAGGANASTMQAPTGVFSDGTSLWVADTGSHRVLVWTTFPTANGQAADLVLGQTSFSNVLPNQGASATASSLCFPSGIDVAGGVVYVADTGNNRVVSFSTAPSASGASADGVLGQMDLVSRGAANVATDLGHLAGPLGITHDSENMYVTERDLGRILIYSLGTIMSTAPATSSISTATGLAMTRPRAAAVERTAFFTSRLYVADTGDDRVAVVQSVSRLASP